ncbi:MAG: Rne/Rng family ribonuclease, partial [Proteobacteria bacterium]|nr:Rne/Rng family ribonuclease [Pseudomonadota bacterium]
MSKEILINVSPMETRVALIENSLLQEIFIERHNNRGHVGDVFVGKVVRVMPGMEAAFVDVGLDRAAFLHAADISTLDEDGFEIRSDAVKTIQALVHEGQSIVVQVAKDAIGTKGARLTTALSLPARNLVYLPRSQHLGISQRLQNDEERARLLALLAECLQQQQWTQSGFIIRTAAEGATAEAFIEDIRFLKRLWSELEQRVQGGTGIRTVYREFPLYMRTIRDLITPEVEKIRIDDSESCQQIQQFLHNYVPELTISVEFCEDDSPVFALYGVEDEINKALRRQVKLKSGGDLIIDQTEAMTTIDVNTGAYLGRRNHAETVLKTNLEAATAIARQLRLRNLGGIIILDFIDMLDDEHKRQVQRELARALEKDNAKTLITDISPLGLIEMTRRRTRESLGQILNDPCEACAGRGYQKSAETVCYEIFREIMGVARSYE